MLHRKSCCYFVRFSCLAPGKSCVMASSTIPFSVRRRKLTPRLHHSLTFTFPPLPVLQLSADGHMNWTDAPGLSGRMTFDINPDASQHDLILLADVRYARADLFNSLSICHTQTSNTSVISLRVR